MSDIADSFDTDPHLKLEAAEKENKRLQALVNRYDDRDIIRREGVIVAGCVKVAAYRVRDLETKRIRRTSIPHDLRQHGHGRDG